MHTFQDNLSFLENGVSILNPQVLGVELHPVQGMADEKHCKTKDFGTLHP